MSTKWARIGVLIFVMILLSLALALPKRSSKAAPPGGTAVATASEYVVLSWNDLGMHCYNNDFADLAVLPPFNTLWAQVVKRGDPPEIVTQGINVAYYFPDNTTSLGKTNFWDYDTPFETLIGAEITPDHGLTGATLAGNMHPNNDHFVIEGIPLTEYRDSDPLNPYPYQLAQVVVTDSTSGAELTRATVVAPVSTEMHCDNCHYDGGVENIRTGKVETNILTLHDRENRDEYPNGHASLMDSRPVLCAECHSSNALGAPGVRGIPSLSNAMHEKHNGEVSNSLDGCYNCHPGPQTQCLRDTMSQSGMDCISCHGSMNQVSKNNNPWLNEPRCDTCHNDGLHNQDQPLYRMSKDHGGVYCAGCHDSPHAIAPSAQPNDQIKFIQLQGHGGTLQECSVCHTVTPSAAGPHSLTKSGLIRDFLPVIQK